VHDATPRLLSTPRPPTVCWLSTRSLARSYNLLQTEKQNNVLRKKAENLSLSRRLENGCLVLMATSAPAGSLNNNTYNTNSMETVRQLSVSWLSLAKIDGQILSGRSDSCNCQAGGMWHVAGSRCKLCATLQNYQCGNQFHQFSLLPLDAIVSFPHKIKDEKNYLSECLT